MRTVEQRALEAYRRSFQEEPEVVASAPGRVNLIGEHTDYSGGFVLPCAIDRRVAVAMGAGRAGLHSADFDQTFSLDGCRRDSWAAYPRGVSWAMMERQLPIGSFQAAFAGDVPMGAGLSSSAAIEAATALALDALFDLQLARQELALICQRADHGFVGVNSGIMDQYASLLCREGAALLIDCRSLAAKSIPLDLERAGLRLLVCDTRVQRELRNSRYNDRQEATERAARLLGKPALRDATEDDVERLTGDDRRRARHVVTENARVLAAVEALQRQDFAAFGTLLYASHASLRDDFAVSTRELDTIVEVARDLGALGARLTGAGFGGCAIVLVGVDESSDLEHALGRRFAADGFAVPAIYEFHPAAGAEIAPNTGERNSV
jgi:galactokinase